MFLGNIETVNHEQHKDNIRRAEMARLVKQLEAGQHQAKAWQVVKARWMAHFGQEKASAGKLVKKVA